MRVSVLFVLVLTLHTTTGLAADPSAWFAGLTRLDLKNERVRIWYPKAAAQPVTVPPAYLKEYEQAGVYAAEPLVLELGHGLPKLALACDSGPSNDPSCRLLPKFDDPASAIFESAGNDFVFLANGDIRVFGNTDQLYDHRRLFRFDGKRFNEVAQPFRYVGVEGKAKSALALTGKRGADAKNAASVLVTLEPGTPLTILLNVAGEDDENGQNADYLVRTREGLVGWAHIPTAPDGTTIIEGLRYNGD